MPTTTRMVNPITSLQEISGITDLTTITEDETHVLAVGKDSFRCAHCSEDHPLALIWERDEVDGGEHHVMIRYDYEAVHVAEFLLDTFGIVTRDEWQSAVNHIAERRALGTVRLDTQA